MISFCCDDDLMTSWQFSYTKEIREARTRAQSGKAHGKVFVKVLGLRDIHISLPSQPTFFTCVLNNGIHFVETPVVQLARDCLIDQEFELYVINHLIAHYPLIPPDRIEHEKLEFTLTVKIRKDPHISAILNPPPPLPAVRAATPSKSSVMRSLFSSPKHKKQASSKEAPRSEPAVDPFGRYMRKDLTVGRAFISFKDIQHRCDTKLFETSYPLIGQIHDERLIGTSGKATMTTPIGEIVLQVFRLPPIPGVPADELPQSLEDCHRGLRHVQWHKKIYHEGGLTQYGGDCTVGPYFPHLMVDQETEPLVVLLPRHGAAVTSASWERAWLHTTTLRRSQLRKSTCGKRCKSRTRPCRCRRALVARPHLRYHRF